MVKKEEIKNIIKNEYCFKENLLFRILEDFKTKFSKEEKRESYFILLKFEEETVKDIVGLGHSSLTSFANRVYMYVMAGSKIEIVDEISGSSFFVEA